MVDAARLSSATKVSRRSRWGLPALVLALGVCGTVILWAHVSASATQEAGRFAAEDYDAALAQKQSDVEIRFGRVYDAIRLIANLPGMKQMDRHAQSLHENARTTAHVIFDNLHSAIRLSKVSVVPVDIEPDQLDPVTGRLQEPILQFDRQMEGHPLDTKKPEPEAETLYEYRAMKDQCRYFQVHFPNLASVQGNLYPAITSGELVTSDNSDFTTTNLAAHDDLPRLGIVYSVPFYAPDGELKGIIAAVLRSQVIDQWVDSPYMVLSKPGFAIGSDANHLLDSGTETYGYSKADTCSIADIEGWTLRAWVPMAQFTSGPDFVLAASNSRRILPVGVILTLAIAALVWSLMSSRDRALRLATSMTRSLAEAKDAAETANRAKSEFLARMSHEIRTPLNGVVGTIDLLHGTKMSQDQKRYTLLAREAAKALMQVINDILDFSKIEAGKVEVERVEFDLHKLVDDVTELQAPVAANRKLALACVVRGNVPRLVMGDPARVRQVLTNLLSNALKFTTRGSVNVRVLLEGQQAEKQIVRIEVEDTGLGIPADRVDRLFKSFSQVDSSTNRKFGGTGLGLAISKRLVELMNGRIGVQSKEGVGTTFWFTLKLDIASTSAGDDHAEALRNVRVLAIESASLSREILEAQLEGRLSPSSRIVRCEEAMEALLEAAADSHPYDVALIPYSSTCVEALLAVIGDDAISPQTKMIAVVDIDDSIDPDAAKQAGFVARVCRPLTQSRLLDAIASATVSRPAVVGDRPAPNGEVRHILEGLHLLVAEDNEMNQFLTQETLRRVGCLCEIVADGAQAVEAAQNRHFDAVLMDCQMPGMDGLEATARIRLHEAAAGSRRIPIIALTAEAMQGDREKCLGAGMDAYVSKPINPDDLFAAIQSVTVGKAA